MLTLEGYQQFRDHIIAQDDDNDYQESGYVVVVKDKRAALARYSHCSCDGTWDSLSGTWDWEGTIPQLIKLAKGVMDPNMPKRKADPKDYDYDHLTEVYRQVLEWAKARKVAR